MPSIRVVVVGIENPAQNDASGPRHARVQLTRYLHDLYSDMISNGDPMPHGPSKEVAN